MSKNLRPSPREVRYERVQFYESLKVQGIPCTISSLKKSEDTHDFYGDLLAPGDAQTHEDSFRTMITFETMPSVQTLRSYGWYQDDSEGLPVVAHIPLIYESSDSKELTEFAPSIDDRIVLTSNPNDRLAVEDKQSYLIKDLKGVGFPSVIYYVAKITPDRRNAT